ncbi:hypothetical protein VNI00_003371 [Paramarasmius palmivorus]|uniref:Uncharacterized protein n=1 Tax=Paramarasmius palmivorus TaxID=297713 RepID=A0AAW0DTK3_9AGAR
MWRSGTAAFRSSLNFRSVLRVSGRRYKSKASSSSPDELPYAQTHSVQEGFAHHPIFVFNVAKRFIKFSFIGLSIVGTTYATVYEGSHQWVENVELKKREEDEEVHRWEWDLDREKWSGDDEKGGTDPGLGIHGRHMVRAAWMALNWGASQQGRTAVIASEASSNSGDGLLGPRGLRIIDPRLVLAEACLHTAVDIAERKSLDGKLHPWTLPRILALHASILARMGPDSLPSAKEQYERAWASQPALTKGIGEACPKTRRRQFPNRRKRCCFDLADYDYPNSVIQHMPPSPSAQRTLLSILSSTSALYAVTGKLKEARALDEASFGLIRSIRHPESISTVSAAHALHALTLLQRSSVCCIRLGEIHHALKARPTVPIQWLSTAAQSSERRCHLNYHLKRGYLTNTTGHSACIVHRVSSMHQPSQRLLRDSRRTAAESWNLIGMLSEKKDPKYAASCFKRAVLWASKADAFGEPGEETLARDWEVIWGNYSRLVGAAWAHWLALFI